MRMELKLGNFTDLCHTCPHFEPIISPTDGNRVIVCKHVPICNHVTNYMVEQMTKPKEETKKQDV